MGKIRKQKVRITDSKLTHIEIYKHYLNSKKYCVFLNVELEILLDDDTIEIDTPVAIDFGNLRKIKRK